MSAAAKAARSLASGYGGDVQSPAAAAAMQGAVEAAVRVHGNHHEPHHGHGAHGHAQGHGAPHSPTRGLRSGAENPHHHAFRPSLQEAEAFLLSELKKLELANARLMTAREHLGEITRQLQEAVRAAEVNLLARERRDAAARTPARRVAARTTGNLTARASPPVATTSTTMRTVNRTGTRPVARVAVVCRRVDLPEAPGAVAGR